MAPVYRAFSNRAYANHRYMNERATCDQTLLFLKAIRYAVKCEVLLKALLQAIVDGLEDFPRD
jgi:hypothetical protein